jgi:hypothetical protein
MTKIEKFWDKVIELQGHSDILRQGQIYFHALLEVDPEMAETLRGTELDPFYVDDNIAIFVSYIESHMESPFQGKARTCPSGVVYMFENICMVMSEYHYKQRRGFYDRTGKDHNVRCE